MADDDAANLQKRVTVKEAAKVMGVSERSVYMMAEVMRRRPDLVANPEGKSIHALWLEARGESKRKPTSWDRLVRAWNNATEDERAIFIAEILKSLNIDLPANLQSEED